MRSGSDVALRGSPGSECKLIERACRCAEMLLREVEIDGGLFEVTMPEQDLDGAQVSTCFQQVRGKAVPQCVGMNLLILQPGLDRSLLTDRPEHLGGDRTA